MHVNVKIDSRLRQQCSKLYNIVVGVLSLAPCYFGKFELQVRMADQAMYHQGSQSVFVGGRLWTLLPPPANL